MNVTVEGAELSAVSQTTSRAFTATFTSDASEKYTKDNFTVVSADGTQELAVKSVDYSADGASATVTLYTDFTDEVTYNVTCGDVTKDLTASVGEVTRVTIDTASAQQNVKTDIEFTLYDDENIDVTPSIDLDSTCIVTATGDYSAFDADKASEAAITFDTVGNTAEVTVTYNKDATQYEDVTVTSEIVCVDPQAALGTKMFYNASGNAAVNGNSDCAKFYLGLSDSAVYVSEGSSTTYTWEEATVPSVYFCATDDNGDVISYDSYEIESANDEVASAEIGKDSGKYATITVAGVAKGSTQLIVTATKNGKSVTYTIPVVVTDTGVATSMTVGITRTTMSNVDDSDYCAYVWASLYDADGNWVSGDIAYELKTTADSPIEVGSDGKVTAVGATAKTYTIQVTGSDNSSNSTTFTKNVTLTVKALPDQALAAKTGSGVSLTYQIETEVGGTVGATAVDEAPEVYSWESDDSFITTRLYATYNGLFAGYVRSKDGEITVAEGNVVASSSTKLADVAVAVKYGTKYYNTTSGLVTSVTSGAISATYEDLGSTSSMTYQSVSKDSNGVVIYTPTDSSVSTLAKTGTYTVDYRLYYAEKVAGDEVNRDTDKNTSKTKTFTVKNSVVVPTVTVTSKTVDTLGPDDIIANLVASVDMNNDNSAYESILGTLYTDYDTICDYSSTSKQAVKYVVVEDTYADESKWNFYVPINATFKVN